MDPLVKFIQRADLDVSSLDSTIAEYIVELAKEGGTEEEAWSVLEGCYPELEEAPEQRQGFAEVLAQLRRPAPSSTEVGALEDACAAREDMLDSTLNDGGGRNEGEDADIDFLREMMPHVSNRGLKYVLRKATNGGRVAAASYLADRCAREGSGLKVLEAAAETWEREEQEKLRKSKEAERINEEAKRRDKEERDAFKDKIVGRYADQTEGTVVKLAIPASTERAQKTRYRDGKVVTTTGAKVVVENLKPEWDGGSRGKVKTKGKRGKGFV